MSAGAATAPMVQVGLDTTIQHGLLQVVILGRRCRIINSVVEGHPEWPVVIGDDVTLINCHGARLGSRAPLLSVAGRLLSPRHAWEMGCR